MLNKIAHVNGVFPFFTAKPGPCVAVRRNARINRYFHEILALSGVSRSQGNLPKTEGVQRDHFSSLVGITAHATRDVSALMMRSPALPQGVAGLVEDEAKDLEMFCYQPADERRVLANPSGKHHPVRAMQRRRVSGDMPCNAVHKGFIASCARGFPSRRAFPAS